MSSNLLFLGCTGQNVSLVQTRLNFHGFGQLSVDGDFGSLTQEAVVQFQMAQGLTADGIVGPDTMQELMNDYDAPKDSKVQINALINQKGLVFKLEHCSSEVSAVMNLAISDLGKKEYPNGSNEGPEIDHLVSGYHDFWKINKDEYPALPWCAMAVSRWIYLGLDLASWDEHPFKSFFGGCSQIELWAKVHGKHFTVVDSGPPPVGAIFLMSRATSGSDASSSAKSGHTGLVLSVTKNTITTVEGNVANSVTSKTRKLSDITGYVLWWE